MVAPAPRSGEDKTFAWEGENSAGLRVGGEIHARGPQQALALLRRRGIRTPRLRPAASAATSRPWRGLRGRDIAVFTRQLATLTAAGVPMLQAFDIIARDHPVPRLARVLAIIRTDVEAGLPLSAALRHHPQAFDALYADVVAAGELAGTLDTLLDRLAGHLEKTEALKSRLRAALMYPAAVLAVALAVVAVIMAVVVPAFQDLFAAFGAELPVPTQAVIALSSLLVTHGWLMLALLGASAIAVWQTVRRSPRVRAALEHLLLRLPIAGALLRQSAVTRWTRTLATLFAAGVPLVEALACVGNACGNGRYHAATLRIRQDVAAGSSLSHAMATTRLFPPMALQMAAVGEESGALDRMLAKAADWHEAEVDSRIAGLASLVEPVLVVVLGLLLGGIVVAMYLPVFQLGQVI